MPKATVKWYRSAMINAPMNYDPAYVDSQIVEGYQAYKRGETDGTMSDMACEFYCLYNAGR